MTNYKVFMRNEINNDVIWTLLEDNFNRYYPESNTQQNIPKKIHQIWLGGAFPDKYNRFVETWKINNPEWEYRLWTDADIEELNLDNINQFNLIKNLGAKSDILRYEILYRFGGLYIDTDFECLKNFDDLLYLDLFCGTGHVNEPGTFNGLIACKPKHELIRKLIDNIKVFDTINPVEILKLTGPQYFSDLLFDYIENNKNEKIIVFPTVFFYPFPATERYRVRKDDDDTKEIVKPYLTDKSYCVHMWYTSWQN